MLNVLRYYQLLRQKKVDSFRENISDIVATHPVCTHLLDKKSKKIICKKAV